MDEITTIHQIVPAPPGWFEMTRVRDDNDVVIAHPVAVWALVEDHQGKRFVTGLTAGTKGDGYALLPPDESFSYYVFEGAE